jgi:hypothetical protein
MMERKPRDQASFFYEFPLDKMIRPAAFMSSRPSHLVPASALPLK